MEFISQSDLMLAAIREGRENDAASFARGLASNLSRASNPDWAEWHRHFKHVNDWRTYINEEVRLIWDTFTPEQKCVLYRNAFEIAMQEDWD